MEILKAKNCQKEWLEIRIIFICIRLMAGFHNGKSDRCLEPLLSGMQASRESFKLDRKLEFNLSRWKDGLYSTSTGSVQYCFLHFLTAFITDRSDALKY